MIHASYTVEMSLVMPIILSVVVMLLYLGFYINDRVVLEEAVKESAIYAAATYPSDKNAMIKCVNEKNSEIIAGKLFCMENVKFNTEIEGSYVVVNGSGDFVIPIFSELANKLFKNSSRLKVTGKGVITNPVNKIWLIEIVKSLSGGKDKN